MKHRVDPKILLEVINSWSRVDKNIPVSLWEKIHASVRKIGVPFPLKQILLIYSIFLSFVLSLF